MNGKPDAWLVAEAQGGSHEAFATLVDRYQDCAYGTAVSILSDFDLARDVVQEALLAAYHGLGGLREPERFGGWLHGIVRRTAHRARREIARVQVLAEELKARPDFVSPLAAPLPPDRAAEQNEERDQVRRALARLNDANREAVSLFYIDGLSYADIAGFLSVSESTVLGRLQRGRAELRKELTMVEQAFRKEHLPEDFGAKLRRLLDAAAAPGTRGAPALEQLGGLGAEAVEPLCEALGDPRVPIRRAAALALCRIGDPRALQPLFRILYARDNWIGNPLFLSGKVLAIPGVKEELLRIVREGESNEQYWALVALEHAVGDAQVAEELLTAFRDRQKHEGTRRGALTALCRLRPEAARDLICEALADPALRPGGVLWTARIMKVQVPLALCLTTFGREVMHNARWLAGRMALEHGEAGRAAVAERLAHGSPDERATAAVALAGADCPAAFETLKEELLHGFRERKWSRIVARTLARHYGPQLLAWVAAEKPDLSTHQEMVYALGLARTAAGLPAENLLSETRAPQEVATALRRLATEKGPDSLPELRRFIRDGRPRKAAQEAFRQLLRIGDAALPLAQEMLASEQWTERKAAVCLLRRWDRLTAEQKARALADPHPAVRMAADWHPACRKAAAEGHRKWERRLKEI